MMVGMSRETRERLKRKLDSIEPQPWNLDVDEGINRLIDYVEWLEEQIESDDKFINN